MLEKATSPSFSNLSFFLLLYTIIYFHDNDVFGYATSNATKKEKKNNQKIEIPLIAYPY
jgi:hypothetical protein